MDVEMIYGYDNHRWTHQPRVVYDDVTNTKMGLFWDANGNLAGVRDCDLGRMRYHDWDEENRLRLVMGSENAGYYGYDANGERVYKITGKSILGLIQSGESVATLLLEDAVLYPNPYLTITSQGYTKHYYANGERLASVIGQGGWLTMSQDVIDSHSQSEEELQWSIFKRYDQPYPLDFKDEYAVTSPNVDIEDEVWGEIQYDCAYSPLRSIDVVYGYNMLYHTMDTYRHPSGLPEDEIYYTHNDHLGSAAWITDRFSNPVQYMHYLPYGQLLADQKATTYDERYKFIGKERDWESGYDYFGARYYIAPFLHWMSVDPLSDKDPGISSYAYCRWNPLKYVDPKGEEWQDAEGNTIINHSNIKAYIFYNPKDFESQTMKMYFDLESKYGKGSVALSNVLTTKEFQWDWQNMSSPDIKEVDINHHGNNQTIILNGDKQNPQYITSTGTGFSNKSHSPALDIRNLGQPKGNVYNARLNLNTCHSHNRSLLSWIPFGFAGQPLQGLKQTLLEGFVNHSSFGSYRGTWAGVSYNRITKKPEPQFFFQSWTYYYR